MANYKLYYFNGKGRAEPIRLLFACKGIEYEDVRIPGEKWGEFKSCTPFGAMPVLEENEKKLGGSLVILRYLAEKHDCAGSDAWENAWAANTADFINDLSTEIITSIFEKDEQRKKALQEKISKESIPKCFAKLNEMAGDIGYLCCGKLTWPDLLLFGILENLVAHKPDILAEYPGLAKLKSNIEKNSGIAKWLAERPQTQF